MTNLNPKFNREEFKEKLKEILKDKPSHSLKMQENFISILEKNLPMLLDMKKYFFPDNDDVLNVRKQLDKLTISLEQVINAKKRYAFLQPIECFVNGHRFYKNKPRLDLHDLFDYVDYYRTYLEGFYSLTSRSNKNNRASLILCRFISQIYAACFNKEPTSKGGAYIKQAGDVMYGTPYERICALVSEFTGIDVSWNTTKEALNSDTNDIPIIEFNFCIEHNNKGIL